MSKGGAVTLPPIAAKSDEKSGKGTKKAVNPKRTRALSEVSETSKLIQNRQEAQSVQIRLKPYVPVKLSFAPRPAGLPKSQSAIFHLSDFDDGELDTQSPARGTLSHSVSVPSLMKKSHSTLGFIHEHAHSSNELGTELRRKILRQAIEPGSIQDKISKIIANEVKSEDKVDIERTPQLSSLQLKSKKIVELNRMIASWSEIGGSPLFEREKPQRDKRAQTPSNGASRTSSLASTSSTSVRIRSPTSKDNPRLASTKWELAQLIPVITGRLSLCRTCASDEDLMEENPGTAIKVMDGFMHDQDSALDLSPRSIIAFCRALRQQETLHWTDHLVYFGGETEVDFARSATLLAVYLVLFRGYSVDSACEPFLNPGVCQFRKVYDRNGEWLDCYNIKNAVSSMSKAYKRNFFTFEDDARWVSIGADTDSSFELLQACPSIFIFRVKDNQPLDLAQVEQLFQSLRVGEFIRMKEVNNQSKEEKIPLLENFSNLRIQDLSWIDKMDLQYVFDEAELSVASKVLLIESKRSKETCTVGYVLIKHHGFSVEEAVCWLYNIRPSSVSKSDIPYLESIYLDASTSKHM